MSGAPRSGASDAQQHWRRIPARSGVPLGAQRREQPKAQCGNPACLAEVRRAKAGRPHRSPADERGACMATDCRTQRGSSRSAAQGATQSAVRQSSRPDVKEAGPQGRPSSHYGVQLNQRPWARSAHQVVGSRRSATKAIAKARRGNPVTPTPHASPRIRRRRARAGEQWTVEQEKKAEPSDGVKARPWALQFTCGLPAGEEVGLLRACSPVQAVRTARGMPHLPSLPGLWHNGAAHRGKLRSRMRQRLRRGCGSWRPSAGRSGRGSRRLPQRAPRPGFHA
jgi:hypothetical protein